MTNLKHPLSIAPDFYYNKYKRLDRSISQVIQKLNVFQKAVSRP